MRQINEPTFFLWKHFNTNSFYSKVLFLYPLKKWGLLRSSHQRCTIKVHVLRNFAKFSGKRLCQSLFFNKVAGLRPTTLSKKRLQQRCFPVNLMKFQRTPFLQNIRSVSRLITNTLQVIYNIILVWLRGAFTAQSNLMNFLWKLRTAFSH